MIWPPPWAAIRPLVERLYLIRDLVQPPRRIETVSGAFGRVHVRASDAVWFISESVVALDLAEGRMARLPVPMTGTEGPVGLMTRAEESPSAEHRLLQTAIGRTLGRLGLA